MFKTAAGPYIMNWSAGFQYDFRKNWLAELIYRGTSGVGLLEAWNINQVPLNISKDPAVLSQIHQSTQNYKPVTSVLTGCLTQGAHPNPQFGSINLYSNFGHNTHHAGTPVD